ncbi:outer membrane beta-barrel protein [uncultured Desulfobacter sp.]|uniref:outer membrane beta-barrel protein n=1 Tax=uncultured Desulfobacter sp. TaxID=240139 RepID=UPI002AAAA779|nr:outer membrane beta-barrel protein [uncultured Desulfobacter sp.]
MIRDARWIFTAVFLIFSAWTGAGLAGERFLIKPMIETDYRVDSNFYSDNSDERTVSTLTITPGLEFGFETEKSQIKALGAFNFNFYDDLDDVPAGTADADELNYTGYNLEISGKTMLFTRITTGLEDRLTKTRDPEERDELGNFIDTEEYLLNRFRPWVKYQISSRISAGIEVNTTSIDYTEGSKWDVDSFLFEGKGRLYYEISKFITVDFEYLMGDMEYEINKLGYTSRKYGLNIAGQYKYFKLDAGAGYHEREFDQAGEDDISTPYWHLSIKGQNPTVLGRDEKPKSYMSLNFTQDFNSTGYNNEYYRADRVTLVLGHLFMEKIDARFKGYYQKSDYTNSWIEDREDDSYFLSVMLSYFLNRRFTLAVESGMESRDSSYDDYDYDNSFVLFKLTFNYDLGSS